MCWWTHIWINKLLSVVKFSKFTCTIVTVKLAQTFQHTSELGWTKFIHNLFNWKIYIHNLNVCDGYIFPSKFDIQNVIKLKNRVDSYIKFKLIELSLFTPQIFTKSFRIISSLKHDLSYFLSHIFNKFLFINWLHHHLGFSKIEFKNKCGNK